MVRLFSIYRFPVSSDYRFRLGGSKYRLGPGGVRALKLLAHIAEQTPNSDDIAWLVPLRGHVREIERINPRAALTLVVDRTVNHRLRYLAIWLRGRCGGTLGASTVSRFSTSSDRALRKEVTRCLKRLSAWAELRAIAETDPDPQIRQLAKQSPSKPYAARLAGFSQHIRRRIIARSTPELVVSPELDLTQGRPAKPRWLIRMILDRIHRLITGSTR
jgi:hypothetical protein